jgi:hypothetical protein
VETQIGLILTVTRVVITHIPADPLALKAEEIHGPFQAAIPTHPVAVSALSAEGPVTDLTIAHIPKRRKESLFGQNGSARSLPPESRISPYALVSTSTVHTDAARTIPLNTSAPFAGPQITMPLPDHVSERDRIVTPYNASAFAFFLDDANLTHVYPDLPHKLSHGFPLGDLEPINFTYIAPNHPSVNEHEHDILLYFNEESCLGRMSGPFSRTKIEEKLGGFFRTSPIQVHVVPSEAEKPEKKRICRNFSFKGAMALSVNDCLNSDDYPTRWGSANEVAEIVSFMILDPPLPHFYRHITALYLLICVSSIYHPLFRISASAVLSLHIALYLALPTRFIT